MQTWFDIDAAIDHWRDHLRSCVRADDGHFEHMFIYMIHQNVLGNCQCNLTVVNIIR